MKYSITVLVFNTTIIAINSLMEIQKEGANLPIKLILQNRHPWSPVETHRPHADPDRPPADQC